MDDELVDWLSGWLPCVDRDGGATSKLWQAARAAKVFTGTVEVFRARLHRYEGEGLIARDMAGGRCYRVEWIATPRPLVEVLADL